MKISLEDISKLVGGELLGDGNISITGINSLAEAGPGDISLYISHIYKDALKKTRATALIVKEKTDLFKGPQIVVKNPTLAHAKIAELFCSPHPEYHGISDKAHVHKTAKIGKNVSIYPFVYVAENAELAENVILFPGVYVGRGVSIGEGSVLYPNVVVMDGCIIGRNVILHAGVIIGADGFGFVRDGKTSRKIPQIGYVQIDDNVEIGANSCVDRATLGKTWIKEGVKTDNLVQIAHNVVIGEHTIIVAQAAMAGSVRVGRGVIIGGQVGISDHVTIGDGAMIGSKSGVAKPIRAGQIVSGIPAMPHRTWLRTSSIVSRLPELNMRVRELEKKIEWLQKQLKEEGV